MAARWTSAREIARLKPIREFEKSGQGGDDDSFIHSFAKILCAALLVAALPAAHAAELDPKAVVYKLPDQIKWGPVTPAGNQQVVLFGRPHFHPHDRFITVISGTWWVGTGPQFDPANASVPMPAGSFVTHFGQQVHWDGAKDVDAVILIFGERPATATPFVAASEMKK
jgi:quercetin dioxygenase-like cupin family protein